MVTVRLGELEERNGEKLSQELPLDFSKFLQTHLFIQAMTGSGKSVFLMRLQEMLRSKPIVERYGKIQTIMIDEMDVFSNLPKKFPDLVPFSKETFPRLVTEENLFNTAMELRRQQKSVIFNTSKIHDRKEKSILVGKFVDGLRQVEREYQTPCVLIIDEADVHVSSKSRSLESKYAIIDACKRGRNTNLLVTLSTQRMFSVDIDARSQCRNRIVGQTIEEQDCEAASKMLTGSNRLVEKIKRLEQGQFFIMGDIFSSVLGYDYGLAKFDKAETELPERGVAEEITKPISEARLGIKSEENVIETAISDEKLFEMLNKK